MGVLPTCVSHHVCAVTSSELRDQRGIRYSGAGVTVSVSHREGAGNQTQSSGREVRTLNLWAIIPVTMKDTFKMAHIVAKETRHKENLAFQLVHVDGEVKY